MRCLAGQAARLAAEIPGAVAVADQVDALQRDIDRRRDDALRSAGVIP